MNDSTAYSHTRLSTPGLWRPALRAVAVVLVALALLLFVVGLSGTAAHRGQAPKHVLARERVTSLVNPAAFTSGLENVMLADARLGQASFYAKEHPHGHAWQVNYQVLVSACLRAVAKYDAAASQYTAGALTDQGLPAQIDITAAPTDCREPAS